MKDKENKLLQLYHIRDACERIIEYTKNFNFDSFSKDPKTQDAVIRQIQVIGEAARQLDPGIRDSIKTIPWSDIIGMRHKIIHDYIDVELAVVWDTAIKEVPDIYNKICLELGHIC